MRHRRSIAGSDLAQRHKSLLLDVYRSFQALQFSLNSPYFEWETVHHVSNARLSVDAARRAFGTVTDSKEHRKFSKDMQKEFCTSHDGDETDGDKTGTPSNE